MDYVLKLLSQINDFIRPVNSFYRRVDLAKMGFVTSQGERSVYFVKSVGNTSLSI